MRLKNYHKLLLPIQKKLRKEQQKFLEKYLKIVYSSLKEAEFSKLFSNAFRYTQFAVANEFYMLADKAGLDFNKIRKITKDGYPRAESHAFCRICSRTLSSKRYYATFIIFKK